MQQHNTFVRKRMSSGGDAFLNDRKNSLGSPKLKKSKQNNMEPRGTTEFWPTECSGTVHFEATSTNGLEAKHNEETTRLPKLAEETVVKKFHSTTDSISRHFHMFGISRRWQSCSVPITDTRSCLFTVCCYNVLSQDIINRTMYLYDGRSKEWLKWERRWQNLSVELFSLNADIICLQEVQNDHYEQFYEPYLSRLGYRGIYKKKINSSDGCACFVRSSLFKLIDKVELSFFVPGTVLDRDYVALILVLEPVVAQQTSSEQEHSCAGSSSPIVVATTHLIFNRKRGDVKLAQLAFLLAEIDKVCFDIAVKRSAECSTIPVILCGDFNAKPYSALHYFLTTSSVYYENCPLTDIADPSQNAKKFFTKQLLPWQLQITDDCVYANYALKRLLPTHVQNKPQIGANAADPSILFHLHKEKWAPASVPSSSHEKSDGFCKLVFDSGTLKMPFRFVSAYNHQLSNGLPEITTYHCSEADTVDYVFYGSWLKNSATGPPSIENNETLRLIERYSLLSLQDMNASCGRMPNKACGSDHVPLLARFQLLF